MSLDLIERKLQAEAIANLYSQLGYLNYASRMRQCARWVRYFEKSFWTPEYDDSGELIDLSESEELRLTDAIFCRVRHCPICQWRKSKRWQALALKSFPQIKEDYPDHRWLFLTLTIKNCKLSRLHNKVQQLNKAFRKWVKWEKFPADGWIKCLEVTLDQSNPSQCHPHFHVLLVVPGRYFCDQEMYLSHADWVAAWRKVAKLAYTPVVDIRAVPSGQEKSIIPELLKYGVKPHDLAAATASQLQLLTKQLHACHTINKGGILRQYLRNVGSDDVDLIGCSEQEGTLTRGELQVRWLPDSEAYQYKWFTRKGLEGVCLINRENFNQQVYFEVLDTEDF